MTKIDKPTILERLKLLLFAWTPDRMIKLWSDSVRILHSRESLRLERLRTAEDKRKEKGRQLRVKSQMEILERGRKKI